MTTAPVALWAARARIGLRADAVALAGLALFVAALVAATWGTWGDLDSDTGYDVVAGARIADGELPYRDFTYYYGPLAPSLTAVASLLGGPGFWPAVGLGFVLALAIVGATYALARAVVGPLGAFLAAAITAAVAFIPDNYSYVLPHTAAATVGVLLVLLLLLALWRYAVTERSVWAAGAGLALGLSMLTKPEPAAAALVAVGVWIVVRRLRGLPARRPAALIAGPAVAIPALVYGAFLTVVSPRELVLENLYPVDVFDAGGSALVDSRMPFTLSSFVELGGKLMLYAAGAALLLAAAAALSRRGLLRRLVLGAVVIAGVLAVGAALLNPEALRHGLQYVYGWIPAGAFIAAVALGWSVLRSAGAWSGRRQLELAGVVALAVLAATAYPGFFPHAPHEQIAAYFIPLAAVFLVGVHLRLLAPNRAALMLGVLWIAFVAAAGTGLTLKDARVDSATVHGIGGALAESPQEAGLYQGALDWIERRAEPGEPIFVAPMMTALYPLSGHESPVRELSMLPGALPTADDERRTIAALERAGVRLVVTDDRSWPAYEHLAFGESFDRELAAWIEANFEWVATLRMPGWESFEGVQPPRELYIWLKRTS